MSAVIAFVGAMSRDERREVLRLLLDAAGLPDPESLAQLADCARHDASWMDAAAASRYLALTVTALHKLTAARLIPFHQDAPGCKLWFRRDELDAWRMNGGSRVWASLSTP